MAQDVNLLQQLLLARCFQKEIDTAIMLDSRDTHALRDLIEFYLLAPSIAGGDRRKAGDAAERIAQIDVAEIFPGHRGVAGIPKPRPGISRPQRPQKTANFPLRDGGKFVRLVAEGAHRSLSGASREISSWRRS
jgi:hypothetical protein